MADDEYIPVGIGEATTSEAGDLEAVVDSIAEKLLIHKNYFNSLMPGWQSIYSPAAMLEPDQRAIPKTLGRPQKQNPVLRALATWAVWKVSPLATAPASYLPFIGSTVSAIAPFAILGYGAHSVVQSVGGYQKVGKYLSGYSPTPQDNSENAWSVWNIPKGLAMLWNEREQKMHGAGLHLRVPIFTQWDVVDTSITQIDLQQEEGIVTKDGLSTTIDAVISIKIGDDYKSVRQALYGANDPIGQVWAEASALVRKYIGSHTFDEINAEHNVGNQMISGLNQTYNNLGLEILSVSFQRITPDEEVTKAAALKYAAQATYEAQKKDADATAYAIMTKGEADANAMKKLAEAQAETIQKISVEIAKDGGRYAALISMIQEQKLNLQMTNFGGNVLDALANQLGAYLSPNKGVIRPTKSIYSAENTTTNL
ncbi:TPA: SPFH domain-containing protein [Candidatus Woesearchaeota archaeon]|nr:SPFH domain-containing protein [Candidatus Woesearchaeota archaeon]